ELLQVTDRLIKTVPEVETVFGKAGRAETATDPAPLEMFETTIQFKPKSEWRDGMTTEKLIEELDARVRVPGLANVLTVTRGHALTCQSESARVPDSRAAYR